MRYSRIQYLWAALAVSILMLYPTVCLSAEYDVESKTYFSTSESVSGNDVAPAYEYLDVSLTKIGGRDISFHASGWVRVQLGDDVAGEDDLNQDLNYAYLSIKPVSYAVINVGRVLVYEGVASEQVDGLYGKADIPAGFGAAVFGGVPVETDDDDRGGDYGYGARMSHKWKDYYTVGASYYESFNDDDDFRQEAGVDLRVSPVKAVSADGISSYNLLTDGWMEHTYMLALGPFGKFRIGGEYSDINYEDYFSSTTLSAFDIESLDPEESVVIMGGRAEADINTVLAAGAEYKNYDYDISGSADFYGGLLRFSHASGFGAGLSAYRMDGETGELQYYQYRGYATKKWGEVDATLDFFDVSYDEEINGVDNAYAAVAAVGYNPTPYLRVAADVEYAENPYFDNEFKAFFKVLFKFAGDWSKG